MMDAPYRVDSSPIHGQGVFAIKFIPAGTKLLMPILYPGDFPGFNHSCSNNLDERTPGEYTRKVLRDIQAGEELTVNYGLPPELRKHCNCEKCRK